VLLSDHDARRAIKRALAAAQEVIGPCDFGPRGLL
jgi:hypothetical protein